MRGLLTVSVVLALSLAPGVTVAAEEEPSSTGSFSPAGSLVEARISHTATPLPDGRVLIVGGQNLGSILTSAEVWDPVTASFGPAGSLAEARWGHTATLLPDGRVLIVGGAYYDEDGDAEAFASAEVWDPVMASFGPAGSLAEARWGHTATLVPDGRVLVVGGRGDVLASAEVWDPATASFCPAGSLAEVRMVHTATHLSSYRVLVVGG